MVIVAQHDQGVNSRIREHPCHPSDLSADAPGGQQEIRIHATLVRLSFNRVGGLAFVKDGKEPYNEFLVVHTTEDGNDTGRKTSMICLSGISAPLSFSMPSRDQASRERRDTSSRPSRLESSIKIATSENQNTRREE
jgi:hypothetical protein